MKLWQVHIEGEGFVIDGTQMTFELTGFVEADDPDSAFLAAHVLAQRDHAELAKATGPFPRPIINAKEIQEVGKDVSWPVNQVELHWFKAYG